MKELYNSRAYKYAQYAAQADNPKIGRYVRRQAQEWLDICDGNNEKAYIDMAMFRRISNILKIITHPDLRKSMLDGLEDYALFFIFAIFCTMNEDGGRYYTTGLLEIARKNFKTFTSAVIFIIAMLISPRFARFFSVAPDLKLSSELKVALRKIIKSSPALEKHFKVLRSEIRCDITEAEYIPLAYSDDKLDGKLAYIFLADEVGAMGSYPIEAMRSSQITLDNPLGILISTQYPNDDNGLIDEIDFAKKQLDGLYDGTERMFALLFEPDEEIVKEWETNENIIYQANPVAVSNPKLFQKLVEKRNLAILYENKRENYLCKHCNIKYQGLGTEGFIDVVKLRECAVVENLDFWRGRRVWLGLDLSQTEDNTAVAMVTYDDDGRVYAKAWGFLPTDRVEIKSAKEKVDYKRHIAAQECFECGDEVVSYHFVEDFILSLKNEYGVDIVQCGYDRYNAISTAQKLESDDYNPIECVEIKQHSSVLHPATKLLKEKILSGEFQYDKNTLLEINFQNARCTEDTNLNKYVNKKRSAGKVDMVVAIINALFLAQLEMLNEQQGFVVQC
jgi:phage terminase large subunit-like protein